MCNSFFLFFSQIFVFIFVKKFSHNIEAPHGLCLHKIPCRFYIMRWTHLNEQNSCVATVRTLVRFCDLEGGQYTARY